MSRNSKCYLGRVELQQQSRYLLEACLFIGKLGRVKPVNTNLGGFHVNLTPSNPKFYEFKACPDQILFHDKLGRFPF